jgi:CRP/FNR family cyclic AMP-dependent transcriptional regulator
MRHHTIDVETTGTLQRLALFEGLREGELAQVARLMTEVAVPAGKVLCREGSYGRQCFILVEGEVTVSRGGVEISRRGPGDLIGELALMGADRRNATVVADTPTRVLVLHWLEFHALLRDHPELGHRIRDLASRRLHPTGL